jgi:hypothetical protein
MKLQQRHSSPEQVTTVKSGSRLRARRNETQPRGIRAAFATLLLAGCAATPVPLQPEHGYPGDWPQPMALGEGLTELNGIYANQGVATTGDGQLAPIALADLIPKTTPRKKAIVELDPDCEDCVALRVLPAESALLSMRTLRFTLPPDPDRPGSPRTFDVASSGNTDATRYTQQGLVENAIVGFGYNTTDITLTCATDGSLVARIHDASGILLLLVIPVGSEEYTWARFERIGELDPPPETDAVPPADQ